MPPIIPSRYILASRARVLLAPRARAAAGLTVLFVGCAPVLLTACDPGADTAVGPSTSGGEGVDVLSLEVRPAVATVYTGPEGGTPTPFEAWATLGDGTVAKLDNVEWTISNSTTGRVDATGVFTPTEEHGGVTYVTARFDGVSANSLVTVTYRDDIVVDGADPSAFTGTETDTTGLWLYPSNDVNFPRNTPGITFQWTDGGAGATEARLHFQSTVTDMTVYTTGSSWTADEDTWELIAGTNAGGSVTADLALVVGGAVYKDAPLTLNVNRMDGEGTIYYWSTSAQGVMKVAYGSSAADFLTPASAGVGCIGCHSVRAGKIAFTYDGGNGQLGVKNLADQSDLLAYGSGIIGNFKTFSPDGRYLIASNMGALQLFDATTMTYLQEIPTGVRGTHPDWSPDGTAVVFTAAGYLQADWSFTDGRIMVMDYLGDGQFGEPRLLYDPPDPYNAYYPTWSPDSQWIAFDVSTEDSYDDASAMLYVMDDFGDPPIALDRANLTDGITNSMPRWGPLPDDSVLWLAFSSKRSYGADVDGNPQIWVSGFDPAKAARGEDPSWPAFWLPGQDISQNNHIPFWSE